MAELAERAKSNQEAKKRRKAAEQERARDEARDEGIQQSGRPVPISTARFAEELKQKTFTTKADGGMVEGLYDKQLNHQIRGVENMLRPLC